jgi:hypothetical protein
MVAGMRNAVKFPPAVSARRQVRTRLSGCDDHLLLQCPQRPGGKNCSSCQQTAAHDRQALSLSRLHRAMWALRPINQEDNGRTWCDEERTTKRDATTGPEKPLDESGAQIAATVGMRKRDRWFSAPIGRQIMRAAGSGAQTATSSAFLQGRATHAAADVHGINGAICLPGRFAPQGRLGAPRCAQGRNRGSGKITIRHWASKH